MNDPTQIGIRGRDGRVFRTVPILRAITLKGVTGFCIHEYVDRDTLEYRVSHIETGAYLCGGMTDGEAFVHARRYDRVEIETKVNATRRELARLVELQQKSE